MSPAQQIMDRVLDRVLKAGQSKLTKWIVVLCSDAFLASLYLSLISQATQLHMGKSWWDGGTIVVL